MVKLLRYTEYVYLVVAVLSVYKIVALWSTEPKETYIFIFFAIVSLGMFFFRRKYRKKFEARSKNNDNR
ncbi:Hypothetical protein I595_1089 [Croceitalea dokdonensis DOKDO 023]|uniref:Uncharacterized protein n=1 Tax=Croceitalea dokdonensis DOKDO 023 TaxID=1300341 RepID=A0A0P7AGS4_9FLAO|nr:hypothetical protein [Croceitalea dokdonensis]KPM32663.1 Hypothetical protein I595_1089 [Croceitalea dokdonensis DOKDO 023]